MRIFIFIFLIFTLSCRSTLQIADFEPDPLSGLNIPHVNITYDEESMRRSFQLYRSNGFVLARLDSLPQVTTIRPDPVQGYQLYYHDAKTFLENALQGELSDGTVNGTARWSVPVFIENEHSRIWLHALTFGVPSLVGFSPITFKDQVKLQLTFKNNNGKVIKSYQAVGQGKASLNIYFGFFNRESAARKAFLEAMQSAFQQIQDQLNQDQQFLYGQLH